MIEPEDLEPRKIELDRILGTDSCLTQERIEGENFPNPIAEDKGEFGKVGAGMSCVTDSAESIADWES